MSWCCTVFDVVSCDVMLQYLSHRRELVEVDCSAVWNSMLSLAVLCCGAVWCVVYCVLLSLYLNLVCFTGLFFAGMWCDMMWCDMMWCDVWACSDVLCAVLYYAVGWCLFCKVWFCMHDYLWSAVCHDLLLNGVERCGLMFYIVRCLVMCCSVLSCRAISCSAM